MADNKTKPTDASVDAYIARIDDATRRKDCETLIEMMTRATDAKPAMWGAAIVGFGVLKYKYASGREGETCLLGFSSRKGDISIYGTGSAPRREELLVQLGKCKTGKGCLYVRRLADIDLGILAQLLADSMQARSP
jgi:hypothetical protein